VILSVLFLAIGLILRAISGYHMESQELIGNLYRLLGRIRENDQN
jgi:hypothetical protein